MVVWRLLMKSCQHIRGDLVRIIHHQLNKGTGAARNSAIENAKGDYLFFLDADDVIKTNCIEVLVGAILRNKAQVVSSNHVKCNEELKIINFSHEMKYNGSLSLFDYRFRYGGDWPVFTWNKLYDISFLRENRILCVPHHLCEDVYFDFLITVFCKRFVVVRKYTYAYVENRQSLNSGGFTKKLAVMYYEAIEKEHEYMQSYSIIRVEDKVLLAILLLKQIQWYIMRIVDSQLISDGDKIYMVDNGYKLISVLISHYNIPNSDDYSAMNDEYNQTKYSGTFINCIINNCYITNKLVKRKWRERRIYSIIDRYRLKFGSSFRI